MNTYSIKSELEKYLSKYPKGYNDKWACRKLEYTEKELWDKILNLTSFLPESSRQKQRVWHILNDYYEIQLCPVSGKAVKWFDNRYFKYFSKEDRNKDHVSIYDKMKKSYKEKTNFDHWWDNKDSLNKQHNTFGKNRKKGKHKEKRKLTEKEKATRLEKIKATNFLKSGYDNPFRDPEIIKQLRDKHYLNTYGKTFNEMISDNGIFNIDIYYLLVKEETKKNWQKQFDKINPNRLNRAYQEWHLDHIYSISCGLRDRVPPEIIGHWTNLQMLWHMDNDLKATRCDKTIKQLYEDYFKAENIQASLLI
jgi:hypothetical protein